MLCTALRRDWDMGLDVWVLSTVLWGHTAWFGGEGGKRIGEAERSLLAFGGLYMDSAITGS